jgi:hypothetical protein
MPSTTKQLGPRGKQGYYEIGRSWSLRGIDCVESSFFIRTNQFDSVDSLDLRVSLVVLCRRIVCRSDNIFIESPSPPRLDTVDLNPKNETSGNLRSSAPPVPAQPKFREFLQINCQTINLVD